MSSERGNSNPEPPEPKSGILPLNYALLYGSSPHLGRTPNAVHTSGNNYSLLSGISCITNTCLAYFIRR